MTRRSFRQVLIGEQIVGLWGLEEMFDELRAQDRAPEPDDAIGVVAAVDRGQGFAPLAGGGHRRRVAQLACSGQLARLVAWYAR